MCSPSAEESQKIPLQQRNLNLAPDLGGFLKCVCYLNPTDTWHKAGVLHLFQYKFISGSSALTHAHLLSLGSTLTPTVLMSHTSTVCYGSGANAAGPSTSAPTDMANSSPQTCTQTRYNE